MKRKHTTVDQMDQMDQAPIIPKTTQRKPMDNPQKKMEKLPASVIAPFLGVKSLERLGMVSKPRLMYDQQISKKEMKKAMMYSVFWTLDDNRYFDKTLYFHLRNPTTSSRMTVLLRNSTEFASTAKQFTLTISGEGDDHLDGIRISNRVEFSYELPIPSKRNVVETFFHWLIEKVQRLSYVG
jgi:hypothetical protein